MKEYKVAVDDDGTETWYNFKGEIHREDGPASTSGKTGTKKWFQHNKLHRLDGPATEFANGTWEYRVHGLLHREDGPAVKLINGSLYYYLNDEEYTEAEYHQEMGSRKRLGISGLGKVQKPCHEGVIVEKDGKRFKLVPID